MQRRIEQLKRYNRQQGAVMVLVVVALLALIAMAGLAMDGGHLLLNKTRLQNAVDAAALSAARTVADFPEDTSLATIHAAAETSALATFLSNLGLADNHELQQAYGEGETPLKVEFSTTLNPFTDAADGSPYVRVTALNLPLEVWLLQVVGFADKEVSASAVAGPIGLNANTCDLLPILACGCDSNGTATPDNPADDCGPDDGNYFGYVDNGNNDISSLDDVSVIKLAGGSGTDVGPGNFRLLRLDGTGGGDLREALAGTANQCSSIGDDQAADTEPGNKSGPVGQGLNTRLGIYSGPIGPDQAPADVVVDYDGDNRLVLDGLDGNGRPIVHRADGSTSTEGLFDYQDYLDSPAYADGCLDGEACGRRELVLPIGDCTGTTTGTSQDVYIYTVGCFFLMQDVGVGGDAEVFGQFYSESEGCDAIGTFTSTPADPNTVFKIVLFRDTDSGDS
ncbi:pilus assembly protein TadG-related protein [Marinobacterium marinum]|uniref:Pilus assembly protein n=1 Tax=Marinobacterium marinum TaxID=2756129 RepID=A0A7W1WWA7_9GAMM|nr:pilus assembly protein TadG-related protein [Marinobacterium marinum]MBA4501415.1 pilus assembly protein [Marinobacterium marinum]